MSRGLTILGELSDADADWWAEHGRLERVDPGMPLIHEGEAIEHVYLVLKGRFAVAQRGEVRDLGEVGPGETMGEMSFIESRPPSADVRAGDEPCEVLSVPRRLLAERLESDAALAARFYRGLARALSARLRDAAAELSGRDPGQAEAPDPELRAAMERGRARLQRVAERVAPTDSGS